MENLSVGIIVGVIVGVTSALTTQLFANWFQYRRGVLEKLLTLYAELVGVLAGDHHRASMVAGFYITSQPELSDDNRKWLVAHEEMRLNNCRDLRRLGLQIHVLESDKTLKELVKLLPQKQPFLAAGSWIDGDWFRGAVKKFEDDIREYQNTIDLLADSVQKKYARWTSMDLLVTTHDHES